MSEMDRMVVYQPNAPFAQRWLVLQPNGDVVDGVGRPTLAVAGVSDKLRDAQVAAGQPIRPVTIKLA